MATPTQLAGVWRTDTQCQCRNETPFMAVIKFHPIPHKGLIPHIDCPNCGRAYYLEASGQWVSDRPLVIREG